MRGAAFIIQDRFRRRVLKFKINNICGCIVLPRAGVLLCAVAARVHVHVHARAVHVYIHACNACYCRAVTYAYA
jgi:hypothetical protein